MSIGLKLWIRLNLVVISLSILQGIFLQNELLEMFLLGVLFCTFFGLPILLSYLQDILDEVKNYGE